jgi:hypothetical protein
MEAKVSSLCSQEPTTGPYLKSEVFFVQFATLFS